MKAIILAGGSGSRLYPMTEVVSKQLQPVYDKPMLYYPISLLMLAGIQDIMIITTERDVPMMKELLGDGSDIGMRFQFKVQDSPRGLSDAFIVGEDFVDGDDVVLLLGDNLFYGDLGFFRRTLSHYQENDAIKATIFGYQVDDPRRYGVVDFDRSTMKVKSIEEKPDHPKSKFAIPGLYIFDGTAPERAKNLKPSARGELEITDLMLSYLADDSLLVQPISRGVTWLDTGTPESLIEASNLIASVQQRQGMLIGCLEEIAFTQGFINKDQLYKRIESLPNCSYTDYLKSMLD